MSESGEVKTLKPSKPMTPAGVFLRGFFLVSVGWFAIPWVAGVLQVSAIDWYCAVPGERPPVPAEAKAQLRAIERRLDREAPGMDRYFPEGRLFSYSFYGFSLVNMTIADPSDEQFRTHVKAELERIIPIIEAIADQAPFDKSSGLTPRGGVIPAGHANRLRAGYVLLDGKKPEIIEKFHADSRLLYEQYMQSPTVNLETYPGQTWPVDNLAALDSIRLHDVFFGTKYAGACRKWEAWMSEHLDVETGMMSTRISNTGVALDGPRGCALSWSLALMPAVAPGLAQEQYKRYREDWFVQIAGMTAVREWPPGRDGPMDADTGPVVKGLGAAASGLGIAAAKMNGDLGNLDGMLRGMELLGTPVWTWRGGKSYFFGHLLLADELALWGKTLRPWAAGFPSWPMVPPPQNPFWPVVAGLVLIVTPVMLMAGRATLRAWKRMRENPNRWGKRQTIALGISIVLVIVWLAVPAVNWTYIIVVMGVLDLVERRGSNTGVMPVP